MGLPSYATWLANVKGPQGNPGTPGARGPQGLQGAAGARGLRGYTGLQGRPGTFNSVDAASVPATTPAEAVITGAYGEHLSLKIPRGLPGVNAVPAAEAVAAYLAAEDSDARGVLDGVVGDALSTQPVAARKYLTSGMTNVTAAIVAAMEEAAATSGVVLLPPGLLTIDEIEIPEGVGAVMAAGEGVTRIRHTGAGASAFSAKGSTGTPITVTADVAARATTIKVTSTAGLAVGDTVVLYDAFPYTTTDSSYRSGEMLRIKSVDSATQVTVWGVVSGSWSDAFAASGAYKVSNSARLMKVQMRSGLSMTGLTIEGQAESDAHMIRAEWVDGVNISNVGIQGGGAGIGLRGCRAVTVHGNHIRDLTDNILDGIAGYAVYTYGPCSNVTITGNTIERVRHAYTTMGNIYGMPHAVNFTGNSVRETTSTAIDTHAAGEDILIGMNVISGGCVAGINVRSRRTVVAGNMISELTGGHGISVTEENVRQITIRDNTIHGPNPGGHGINVRNPCAVLTIENNTIYDAGVDGISINVASSDVLVAANKILGCSATSTNRTGIKSNLFGDEVPATGGWTVIDNFIDPRGYTVNRAIDLSSAGVKGASVIDNTYVGSYTQASTVVLAANSRVRENQPADQPPLTVSGSRGGNAALASLISALDAQGIVVNGSTSS